MKLSWKPVWPKEHGGWGLLFVPVATGISAAGSPGTEVLIYLVMTLAFYLSRPPLLSIAKRIQREGWKTFTIEFPFYLLVTLLVVLTCFTLLVFGFGYTLLPAVGLLAALSLALNLDFVLRKRTKDLATELLATFGFSLGAPAGSYILTGSFDRTALILWLINIIFLVHMLLYIRVRLSIFRSRFEPRGMTDRIGIGRPFLLFLALSATILAIAIRVLPMNPLLLLALLPSFIHAVIGIVRMDPHLVPNRLGFGQLAQCLIFTVLLILLTRMLHPVS